MNYKLYFIFLSFFISQCQGLVPPLNLNEEKELQSPACEAIKPLITQFLKTAAAEEKDNLLEFIISEPPYEKAPELQILIYDPLRTLKQQIVQRAPPAQRNPTSMKKFHNYYDCLKKYVESEINQENMLDQKRNL